MKKHTEYQKSKRDDTLSRINEAYEYLSTTHQPINKSSLSKESGVSRVTLNRPEILAYLKRYPEFCQDEKFSASHKSAQALEAENQMLRAELSQSRNRNNKVIKENLKLRSDYAELKTQYAKVLGMNQKLQERHLIKL